MESSEVTNQLLKNKYGLHKSPEVVNAAKRTRMRTGEKVPQDPLARIQNYLNRFHEIIDQDDPSRREHALDLIKGRFHDKYVIKPNEIPESFWDNQRRIIRERGQGRDLEHIDWEEFKRQNTEAIIADQKSSLDKWVDYLSSSDAPYSDSLKYFAIRSVLNMAEYDKEKKIYPQRSKGTTKPFPDLNREALAYVFDAVEKKYKGQNIDLSQVETEDKQQFEKLLQGENFPKLYAWAIEKVTPASEEQLASTKGEWIRYNQGTNHMPLVQSLQGHGTGWCTAGESTAQIQLKGGDFYVYYSNDRDGKPTIPRAAIRMEKGRIAEIRGIAKEQNLDAGAVAIVEEKLKEFPDGESYKKKTEDMHRLTSIENQMKEGQKLTGEDLVFLYEINSPIEGFGFQKDPRIDELKSQRNPQEDMPIVFGSKNQIASSAGEINKDTRAYVGPLTAGIFDLLSKYNIEHIYTSFPEGRIRIESLEIGGKSESQLEQEFQRANILIIDHAKDMMQSLDFTTLPRPETIKTVRLRVADLLPGNPTTDQIYAKAKKLGLDRVPAEAGMHYRLKYADQPRNEYLYMGMKQITGRYGHPLVFKLDRFGAYCGCAAALLVPTPCGIRGMSSCLPFASLNLKNMVSLTAF